MDIRSQDTALVITDPQNDFLSEDGVVWGLVGESVTENGTIEHIGALLAAAKGNDYDVFISPITTTRRTKDGNSEGPLNR